MIRIPVELNLTFRRRNSEELNFTDISPRWEYHSAVYWTKTSVKATQM